MTDTSTHSSRAAPAEETRWRSGVTVVRARSIEQATERGGRATAFDFTGSGGQETWIGRVVMASGANTGPHHHGRHEVAVYVAQGRSQIRWGDRLEFATEVGRGDFIYFAPYVPHQELNLSSDEMVEFVVVRSDNAGIAVKLDVVPVEHPEAMD